MKRKFNYILIAFLFAFPFSKAIGQEVYGYYNDALLFSQTTLGGSARTMGMGGVQIGLGGDVSNILSNPAGLGFFNRSEFSISPSLNFHNTTTDYFNNSTDAFDTRMGLNNLSLVINRSRPGEAAWRGGSFGISFSRINTFNNEFRYSAQNPSTSIIDYFLDGSTGIPVTSIASEGLIGLAFENYLINPISNNEYDSFIEDFPTLQQEVVSTRGAQNQWSISYGGNFSDKIYIGGGIGLTSIEYRNDKSLREDFIGDLRNIVANESLRINGAGINGTLGLIFRPNETFRFGASVITPTFYRLRDESSYTLETNYNNVPFEDDEGNPIVLENFYSESDIFTSDYNLQTPLKLNGGVAVFFGKNGFLSADVEYVNYAGSRLRFVNNSSMEGDNQVIRDIYRGVVNFKLGGEYRYEIFRFRVGGGYSSDPYSISSDINRDILNLSLGAGIRLPKFYIDLAVVNSRFNSSYLNYDAFNSQFADIANTRTSGILTMGFNF